MMTIKSRGRRVINVNFHPTNHSIRTKIRKKYIVDSRIKKIPSPPATLIVFRSLVARVISSPLLNFRIMCESKRIILWKTFTFISFSRIFPPFIKRYTQVKFSQYFEIAMKKSKTTLNNSAFSVNVASVI